MCTSHNDCIFNQDEAKIEQTKDNIERIKSVLEDVKRETELDKEAEEEFKKWKDFYVQVGNSYIV